MNQLKGFLFILSIFLTYSVTGQVKISDVDFEKIEHKKVRDYLSYQKSGNINSIQDIKPSMPFDSQVKGFKTDERIFVVKDSVESVWNHYLYTNPGDSWNGKRIAFGLLLSKKQNKVVYKGENVSSLDTGQVVYLNLKLFKGLTNLATVFELTSIDRENKIIEFSYIDGNTTEGKQQLFFKETSKGYTEIVHSTIYKGHSRLRDQVYPYFHARMINEFHRNMKRILHDKKEAEIHFTAETSISTTTFDEPEISGPKVR